MYLIVDGPIDLDGSVDTVGGWIVPIEWALRDWKKKSKKRVTVKERRRKIRDRIS